MLSPATDTEGAALVHSSLAAGQVVMEVAGHRTDCSQQEVGTLLSRLVVLSLVPAGLEGNLAMVVAPYEFDLKLSE